MANKTLTRADLSEALYRQIGLSRVESANIVGAILETMTATLAKGESVKLSSFGSFQVRDKNARMGRNPRTGEDALICQRQVVVFRPSATMKDKINSPDDWCKLGTVPTWFSMAGRMTEKAPQAFRTISEAAEILGLPQHVLRFWETRFAQIRPMKRGGGRRYYRPRDIALLTGVRTLLYEQGYTIRGVQRILRHEGVAYVIAVGRGETVPAAAAGPQPEQPASSPRKVSVRSDAKAAIRHAGSDNVPDAPNTPVAPDGDSKKRRERKERLEHVLSLLSAAQRLLTT